MHFEVTRGIPHALLCALDVAHCFILILTFKRFAHQLCSSLDGGSSIYLFYSSFSHGPSHKMPLDSGTSKRAISGGLVHALDRKEKRKSPMLKETSRMVVLGRLCDCAEVGVGPIASQITLPPRPCYI